MSRKSRIQSILFISAVLIICTIFCTDSFSQTIGSPSIDTPTYSSITAVTATLGATIESDGGSPVLESGVVVGYAPNPESTGTKWKGTATAGTFNIDIRGLIPNTTFFFRGYATNAHGTSYTDQVTFATPNGVVYQWSQHDIKGPAAWNAIASSSDGSKLVAAAGYIFTSSDYGGIWTRRVSAGYRNWYGVASSSDGTVLVAVDFGSKDDDQYGGYIYRSTDSGATWIQLTGAGKRLWQGIACSSDGTKLAAIEYGWDHNGNQIGAYIYTSSDSGATWTERTDAGARFWRKIASSSDGAKLVAVDYGVSFSKGTGDGGYIYTSADSGETWTEQTGSGKHSWLDVALSSDGTKLVAASTGSIYTSSDSGATWTEQASAGKGVWVAVASSADGTKIFAAALFNPSGSCGGGTNCNDTDPNGYIYASSDSGISWTPLTSGGKRAWSGLTASANGTRLAAITTTNSSGSTDSDGHIHTSYDSGFTWVERTTPVTGQWPSIASSSDGTGLIAIESQGVYLSSDSGSSWTLQTDIPRQFWNAAASSSDGSILAIAGAKGIYMSTDHGISWNSKNFTGACSALASSSDGTRLVAAERPYANHGYIYTSGDSGETWTKQESAGRRDWIAVTSSSDGTILAAIESGYSVTSIYPRVRYSSYIYMSTDSGATWTQQTSAGQRVWRSIAFSPDGTKLIAAERYGYVYTSADSGATWVQRTNAGNRDWTSVASSSDGRRLAAAANGDYVYVSDDYGVTWTPQVRQSIQYSAALAMSADGSKIVSAAGPVATGTAITAPSVDSPTAVSITASSATLGATVLSNGGMAGACGIVYGTTANPDATASRVTTRITTGTFTVDVSGLTPNTTYHFRGYAVNPQGISYTEDATFTTPAGVFYNWQRHDIPGPGYWRSVVSTPDGARLFAVSGEYIYSSADFGASWNTLVYADKRSWSGIASSSDGSKLAAIGINRTEGGHSGCDTGSIYTSTDSGLTWIERTGAGSKTWISIASSADGTRLVATEACWGGYIYTSGDSGATWTKLENPGLGNWSVAMSSDGTKLVAASLGIYVDGFHRSQDYIYTSSDFGTTWTKRESAGNRYWNAVASSSDGTILIATETYDNNPGYIYTSSDSGATWTQQAGVGSHYWRSVASSSDGAKLFAVELSGYIYTSTDSGATWAQQASAGNRDWRSFTSSADGTKLAAVEEEYDQLAQDSIGEYIYTSTDSGTTWVRQPTAGSFYWQSAASSSDGAKLVAININWPDYIYASSDSGATWTQLTNSGRRYWSGLASSTDGMKLLAAECGNATGGYLYSSSDAGATWHQQTNAGKRDWVSVASSADGVKLIAAAYSDDDDLGHVYTSTDSGATWTERTNCGPGFWSAVASSSDGTKLVAVESVYDSGGYIYTSSDSGATWIKRTSAGVRNWAAIASSSDGTKLIASGIEYADSGRTVIGHIFVSNDSGATWVQQTSAGNRNWAAVSTSSDGTKLFAAEYDGYVYVSTDSGITWTPQTSIGHQSGGILVSSSSGSKIIAGANTIYTGSPLTLPLIDTPTSSSIAKASATLGATIRSGGTSPVTASGVAFGLSANPNTTGSTSSSSVTTGPFTAGITGLTPNTVYFFRGYATNSEGTSYTDDGTFTTIADAPAATAATEVSMTGFTAHWTPPSGTAAVTGFRLDVATDSGFTSFVPGYNNLSVSGTAYAAAGLSPSATYYYRVRAVNAGGASANSNAIAAVTLATPLMTVTSPGGSDKWAAGSRQTITWKYTGDPGPKVKIELLSPGGSATKVATAVSAGKGGSGSYSWTMPSKLEGAGYQVRVTSTTKSSYTATGDSFTIDGPTVKVGSIANMNAGDKCLVAWTYTGNPGDLKIELLKGGTSYKIIKASTSAGKGGAGSYTWTIPKAQATGNDYSVKVTAVANGNCSATSNTFGIAGPSITLTSPTGGENWKAGEKRAITWNYTGSPGNVKIVLLKGGTSYKTIVSGKSAGKSNSGSYTWTIPKKQTAGTDYQVSITAGSSSSATSANFSIGTVQASAGPDQKAKSSALVNLSALNSTGVTEGSAAYRWRQTSGPRVEISDPNAAETVFLTPESGADASLGFQVTVTHSEGGQSEDSCIVNVSESNAPPVAEAGPNQVVAVAQIVELDASGSSSASGTIAAYSWKQISGIPAVITDPSAMQTTFVAPEVSASGEALVFELTVTDGNGLRARDTCIVNVITNDKPPVANAGASKTVLAGSEVLLDGSASMDTDNGIASYRWRQLSGKPVVLSTPAGMRTGFTAPEIDSVKEDMVFELTVTDGAGLQDKGKVVITVVPVSGGNAR